MKCIHTAIAGQSKLASQYKHMGSQRLPVNDNLEIIWHIHNFSDDISELHQIGIISEAFNTWEKYLYPWRFVSTRYPEKAVWHIRTAKNNKIPIDGSIIQSPFDFEANPQAIAVQWPYIKGYQWSLTMLINDEFVFDLQHGRNKIDLNNTIIHEIGHGLNLDHTQKEYRDEIMGDEYNPEARITQDSVNGLWAYHGDHLRESVAKAYYAQRFIQEAGGVTKPAPQKTCIQKLFGI